MKKLNNYIVEGGLLRPNGDEAQVGDSVRLYLDGDMEVPGTILFPIVKLNCGENRAYTIEYDYVSVIRACDINNAIVIDCCVLLNERIDILESSLILYPESFKAVGDGVVDDTQAIKDWVAAIITTGGKGILPSKVYRVTEAIEINGPCSIEGTSIAALYGRRISGAGNNGSDVIPTVAPYLLGSVILQDGPGEHGLYITTTGASVSLKNFGIKFGDAIRFNNTGHGIYANPPVCLTPEYSGERDTGIGGGILEHVYIYGHDGDHYAISLTNLFYLSLNECQGWGGGGLELFSNTRGFFGNSTFNQCYFLTFIKGTAHGHYIHSSTENTNPSTGGVIYCKFTRPQSFFLSDLVTLEGVANPYDGPDPDDQWLFKCDEKHWWSIVEAADFEGSVVYQLSEPWKIRDGYTWTDAAVDGRSSMTFSSNQQRSYAQSTGGNVTFNYRIRSVGSGLGIGPAIGFGITDSVYDPAFIAARYLDGVNGMGFIFAVGGGGASANNLGAEALRIEGSKVATFAETVRLPRITMTAIPTYADDAAADVALPSGMFYRLTGGRTIYIRP